MVIKPNVSRAVNDLLMTDQVIDNRKIMKNNDRISVMIFILCLSVDNYSKLKTHIFFYSKRAAYTAKTECM